MNDNLSTHTNGPHFQANLVNNYRQFVLELSTVWKNIFRLTNEAICIKYSAESIPIAELLHFRAVYRAPGRAKLDEFAQHWDRVTTNRTFGAGASRVDMALMVGMQATMGVWPQLNRQLLQLESKGLACAGTAHRAFKADG